MAEGDFKPLNGIKIYGTDLTAYAQEYGLSVDILKSSSTNRLNYIQLE
ncbi:MAG: hypothetical protein JW841_05535 [Deltaproteobacteria bacterium]|nr:hypothetical protein [Deltaproteobacteria bacterium]